MAVVMSAATGQLACPWDLCLMSYAELVCQSHFSFLQAAGSPEQLVEQAAALGYQALALTDECSVAGVVRAWRTIKNKQLPIKLIVGSLLRFQPPAEHLPRQTTTTPSATKANPTNANRVHTAQTSAAQDNQQQKTQPCPTPPLSLVLLCPDRAAYAELCRIITNCRRRADKGQYQVELWDLQSCRHNLLIWLPSGDEAADLYWGQWLKKLHQGRLWLGQSRLLEANDAHWQRYCHQLATSLQIPRTAVGQVRMAVAEQQMLLDTMTAVRLHCSVAQAGFALSANQEACLRPFSQLSQLFSPALLAESVQIANRCQFELDSLRYEYPAELVPAGQTAMQHLRTLVQAGCQLRFGAVVPKDIAALLEKELQLIEELHYPYYFLTIADIARFAREQQILYQGRGSAANSVVCYCLQITAVDPRKISLLFERFISRERDEPPDIDVDFEHERREEVIQYIYQKYGRERAALAATVICYRLRSALRDVGKALGFSLSQLEFWLQQLNRRHPSQSWWQQLGKHGLDLQSHPAQLLIQLVEQLRGKPRHLSQHVGGFVIASGPLYELVPVENAAMPNRSVIQWDKDDLESLGLLKVDILALGMLTALRKALQLVNQNRQTPLCLAEISNSGDDPAVYQMISQADTIGVFQIESRAQMSMLPRLKPRCFYDLVIEIAIVRPGPIQGDMVHPYLRRRHGIEPVHYPSAAVADVLERTLGVPIFQEQVIKLAMVAAGFTGGEADQLRRAMASWKKTGELLQFRPKLLDGMQSRGYSLQFAEQIFQQICGFGEYGFPESHSASFALLAYASAWLKHYYPLEFLTALLNSLPMGFYSPAQLIADARRHQLHILPVCINQSSWDHQLENCPAAPTGKALRLGLRQVKGLSAHHIQAALQNRPPGGFQNLQALKALLPQLSDLQALASADALRAISGHRFASRWQLADRLDELPLFQNSAPVVGSSTQLRLTFADSPSSSAEQHHNQHAQHQYSQQTQQLNVAHDSQSNAYSSDTDCPLPAPTAWQQLLEDQHSLGLSLSQHPLALLRPQLSKYRLHFANTLASLANGSLVRVAGVVTVRQSPGTAAGVTFVTLEDETGPMNLIVWQATSLAQQQAFISSRLLLVYGTLQQSDGVIHIIAGRLISLDNLLPEFISQCRNFH